MSRYDSRYDLVAAGGRVMIKHVLVTGATGYVGGRLVPRLLEAGYLVHVLVRNPAQLQGRTWLNQVEVIKGDILKPETLPRAMVGMQAAYYLIHSMGSGENFRQRDRMAARNFSRAAKQAGLQRIIYLGGLGNPENNLSEHLRSRQETGEVLREAGIPVVEFRSAIIVGSGSASFEMMRYMVEVIPILLCPRWVMTRVQPISIRDVLEYLVAALELPEKVVASHKIIEIGGSEVLTYRDMMRGYARARGLRRMTINLPFLSTRFYASWAHWLTPISMPLTHALIEGLHNEVIVRDHSAARLFPGIRPRGYPTSLERALARVAKEQVETTWSDAQISTTGDAVVLTLTTREGLYLERRQKLVPAPAEVVYRVFTSLGGKRGWLYANWVWLARGIIDRMVGGPGFRRGRRHPSELRVGDTLDFWRVEAIEPVRLVRLRAEMKVPGLAWLQFEAIPHADGKSTLVQTAFFEPKGSPGVLYWYALYPIHGMVFAGLIRKIAVLAASHSKNPAILG